MKSVAKWIAIVWSLFCLVGIIIGLVNAGKLLDKPMNEYEEAGASLGIGCGMGIWLALWIGIAGPAALVYLLAGRNKEPSSSVQPVSETVLCPECGNYGPVQDRFCPHCGNRRA